MSGTTGKPDDDKVDEPEVDQALDDEKVDEAMDGTFPASDPPAHTGTTGPGDGKTD